MIEVNDVKVGRHDYSCRCGWIDWGHAAVDRADLVAIWQRLPHHATHPRVPESAFSPVKSPGDKGFLVRYSVFDAMTSLGGKFLQQIPFTDRNWFVPDRYLPEKYKSVALAIYQDGCELFETVQAFGRGHSSFSLEDLISNRLAFYQLVDKWNEADVRRICGVVPRNESIALALEMAKTNLNRTQNRDWNRPVLFPQFYPSCCPSCIGRPADFPPEFSKYAPAKLSPFPGQGDAWMWYGTPYDSEDPLAPDPNLGPLGHELENLKRQWLNVFSGISGGGRKAGPH